MKTIKSVSALLLGVFLFLNATAQDDDQENAIQKNNIIKLNLTALVVKNVSVQYERKIGHRFSVAANLRYMPFGKLPFLSQIREAVDDPTVPVDLFKLGAIGVTPEIRFYVGKKGALQGFYLAPFANHTTYKADLPLEYSTKTGIFNGNVKALTGGLLLGAQWKIGNSLSLDWWILGPSFGSGKGDLVMNSPLTEIEQIELANEIEDLRSEAPFDDLIESYTVNSNGATIRANGPWAGLRGFGINLGIRF